MILNLLVLGACANDKANSMITGSENKLTTPKITKGIDANKLSFSYTIDRFSPLADGNSIDISCKLHNWNTDTLYFFTYTCFDWEHNFITDPEIAQIYSMIDCNVSNTVVKKIAPNDVFSFYGHFLVKDKKLKSIDVQYYIYQVDANFDVNDREALSVLKKTIIPHTVKSK